MTENHRAPHDCPVCGDRLAVTRLGCNTCGSEIGGEFATCEFCSLDRGELETLKVFLASRGNLREVEKHLGVSYPTARLRLTQLLMKLGLSGDAPESPTGTLDDPAGGDDAPRRAASDDEPATSGGDDDQAPSGGDDDQVPSGGDDARPLTRDQVLAGVADGSISPARAQRLLASPPA